MRLFLRGCLLKHPDKRREIARAGHQRAAKEHTWVQRFRTVLSKLRFNVSSR
jgi:spore maturation protein CgeB